MSETDTRQRIVETAMRLFWQKGYASTSVADILQAAKINSGSLYHYFEGKQDVLLAVLDAFHEGIWDMLLNPAWEGETDPIGRVFRLLARYRAALLETDHTYGCPIGSLALEIHEPDPPVRKKMVANFTAWTNAVEQCLVDAGPRLPADLDRAALATFVLTTMEGAVMLARTYRDIAPFDAAVAQLRDHLARLEVSAGAEPAKRESAKRKPGKTK